jgi:hypothetical protein
LKAHPAVCILKEQRWVFLTKSICRIRAGSARALHAEPAEVALP